MKSWLYVSVVVGILVLVIVGSALSYTLLYGDARASDTSHGFTLDTLFLKMSLAQGGNATRQIAVHNTDRSRKDFSLEVYSLAVPLSTSPELFSLDPGATQSVILRFNTESLDPGVYLASLRVRSGEQVMKVPVLIEIQSKEVLFDANVNLFPRGGDLIKGQQLQAELRVFDLQQVGRKTIDVQYFVKGFDDSTIVTDSEALVVDGRLGRLDYSRTFDMGDSDVGEYVFITLLTYGNSTGTASAYFNIVQPQRESFIDSTVLLILLLFGFFFFLFLVLFVVSLFYRDRLLLELHKEYMVELRKQRALIENARVQSRERFSDRVERRAFEKELQVVKHKREKALHTEYAKRVSTVHRLKATSPSLMTRQMRAWKKKGYDTRVLERKYTLPSVASIKKKVSAWKKKGYDTRVLGRHFA